MISTIYLGVIQTGAVIGGIYGCYKGFKVLDNEGPSTHELFEDGRIIPACTAATIGCGIGVIGGVTAGALSPFLGTGLLVKLAYDRAMMMLRLCLKNAHEKATT